MRLRSRLVGRLAVLRLLALWASSTSVAGAEAVTVEAALLLHAAARLLTGLADATLGDTGVLATDVLRVRLVRRLRGSATCTPTKRGSRRIAATATEAHEVLEATLATVQLSVLVVIGGNVVNARAVSVLLGVVP